MSLFELQQDIERGCHALQLDVNNAVTGQLATFVTLLEKWNRVYNLTAVRDPKQMVVRHILDSLAVIPFLIKGRLLDIGTGAGLPGIPIAIVVPSLSVTLLDSNAKKLRFVRQAVSELKLENTQSVQVRMQEYQPAQAFDMVISRAVSSIQELYEKTASLLRPGGRLLVMKGACPQAEIEEFEQADRLHVEPLQVPCLNAERHLIWFEKPHTAESK